MYKSEENSITQTQVKQRHISVTDAVAIVAGMVIGPGILKTPSIVAANSYNEYIMLVLWVVGGVVSFIGALCYAELSSTYPHAGGEYHYLTRSFGKRMSFLFAWARMTVIQTGSIAFLSFVIGDYASEVFRIGPYSSSIYAAVTVFVLTWINLMGIKPSSKLQKVLMVSLLAGIAFIVIVGLVTYSFSGPMTEPAVKSNFALGTAMIFILLTYGGWNEAAYLSADVGRSHSNIVRVLFYSIGLITFVYLVTNVALIKGMGFQNMPGSETVAADLISKTLGGKWVVLISIIISVSAVSTVNAVMITGARTNYALGNDFNKFRFLSRWNETDKAPVNAFFLQTGIALSLIFLGTFTRSGFVTMVEYTAPVFWFFFLMVGISLFVLRRKDPDTFRPFVVPLYPLTPVLFCTAAVYMLYSSLAYTGIGALIGVMVLLAGVPFLFFDKSK